MQFRNIFSDNLVEYHITGKFRGTKFSWLSNCYPIDPLLYSTLIRIVFVYGDRSPKKMSG